jgi:hypothetical protein
MPLKSQRFEHRHENFFMGLVSSNSMSVSMKHLLEVFGYYGIAQPEPAPLINI